MQSIRTSNTAMATDCSAESTSRREVLRLSDMDAQTVSDLSGMFGKWFETDHCDKDDR